ncbi:polysaccharide biosynthesis/export family protein [Mucilaginibacter sp. E4BP6]|uniref:polysaccharide biosynthesis/export family protein n=1 Tax=Mucilaginibacter sp. E4BP6 TaxID=2723089 RepID=UPI0015C7B76E|nr:polysaccharide biosynthesis/export family protein [Mucilaginibacter sp. E4BP6]NYE67582.1 polysaccharide export outer membrane protein [Mucilaginibacter sp. E4BP6]
MRVFIFVFLTFSLLSVLTSCSYKQDQLLFQEKQGFDSISTTTPTPMLHYHIQPQDILQIRNLQNISYIIGDAPSATASSSGSASGGGSSLQGQDFQVEEDGSVALPVIGRVQVAGLTRQEAANKVEELYKKSLLKDPIIELKIVNLKITILGEIKTPGNYQLIKDKTTLIELIGEAGGLTDKANETNVEIIRGDPAHPNVIRIDLSNIKSLSNPNGILQNGDIIYVAQNKRAIQSDKISTFSTIIQPALIILNTFLIIFTLARH